MQEELQDIFPRISGSVIFRILLSIKTRYIKYGTIGLSRLESIKYGISERQMNNFIIYLQDIGAIEKRGMVEGYNNKFKCNIYSISDWFKVEVMKIKSFIKRIFEYIDPISYVKSRFNVTNKYGQLKFKVNGNRYQISTRGRFKNVIYDIGNNCIISPLNLGR